MKAQIYLDGSIPGTYRGYEAVIGHAVHYRVPGRDRLMSDFYSMTQHCHQVGIEQSSIEMVIVVLTAQGPFPVEAVGGV